MSEVKERTFSERLSDPFEEGDVRWRVQQSGMSAQKKAWVKVIPYISSRAVQQRLDDIFDTFGWENAFKEAGQNVVIVDEWQDGNKVKKEKIVKKWLCGITVIDGDRRVTKWDGAEETTIEPFKGGLSGSEKRAAVQFGIGRYLYLLDIEFAKCELLESRWEVSDGGTHISIPLDKKKPKGTRIDYEWFPPPMPAWALPSIEADSLIEEMKNATNVIELRSAFTRVYNYAKSFNRPDLIQPITELKDKRLEELTDESNSEDEAETMKIRVWLERAVTDEIMSATNESVLKLAKKRLTISVNEKCMEECLDPIDLLQVLETHYTNQLAKLN